MSFETQQFIPKEEERARNKKLAHNLSHALIREYLEFHKQDEVLKVFDKHNKQTKDSITKRKNLSNCLSLSSHNPHDLEEIKDKSILEAIIIDRLQQMKKFRMRPLGLFGKMKKPAKNNKDKNSENDSPSVKEVSDEKTTTNAE